MTTLYHSYKLYKAYNNGRSKLRALNTTNKMRVSNDIEHQAIIHAHWAYLNVCQLLSLTYLSQFLRVDDDDGQVFTSITCSDGQ